MTQWVRLWEDMPTDPKWRVISRRSGRSISEVIAVFNFMMINAGDWRHWGALENWNDDDIGAALDVDGAHILEIRDAMQGKVLHGDKLLGWEKRQTKSADQSAERTAAWRERKRLESKHVTVCDGRETPRDAEEKREDKIRKDIERKKEVGEARTSSASPKKAHRLPDDWALPPSYREWARTKGWDDTDIDRQATRILNWSRSAKNGAKLDWFRAWQNWIDGAPRNVGQIVQFNGNRGSPITAFNRQSAREHIQEFQRQADESKARLELLKAESNHEQFRD